MSAVGDLKSVPTRSVDTKEPEYPSSDRSFVDVAWGPYEHSEDELRGMWSRIWRCFKSRRLCEDFIRFNKSHSLEIWAEAFEQVRVMKDGEFHYIRYVMKIAGRYEASETPTQVAEREARERQEQAAMRSQRSTEVYQPSPKVREYWAAKTKTRSVDDIPGDHPGVLRMMRKLEGDGLK